MTTKYKITNKDHPHAGCTGRKANDPEFPLRTFIHFPPMFALKLDETHLGVDVCYVDRMDVEEIDDKNND